MATDAQPINLCEFEDAANALLPKAEYDYSAGGATDGVIVSNQGGRHLDSTLATVEVLSEAVAAARGKLEVFLDVGIRRGADVVKAIALGAQAVFIGRPLFWGSRSVANRGMCGCSICSARKAKLPWPSAAGRPSPASTARPSSKFRRFKRLSAVVAKCCHRWTFPRLFRLFDPHRVCFTIWQRCADSGSSPRLISAKIRVFPPTRR